MAVSNATIQFLRLHRDDDPVRLLLSAPKHPDVDMPWVAQQIEGRRQARDKWPLLSENEDVWYPPRLNREQSSSEVLAGYKSDLLRQLMGEKKDISVADLTGGFGVDSYCLSRVAAKVDYVELDAGLVETAQHNFESLGADNINCHQGDSIEWLREQDRFDVIFVDPARRDSIGRKVSAFEDCAPNILEHLEMILSRCRYLLVKASPMISIPDAVDQLGLVCGVDVAAYRNECKEVIFCVSKEQDSAMRITAVNIEGDGREVVDFTLDEEQEAADEVRYYPSTGETPRYLYEPNAAIMKAGCYNMMAVRYGLSKMGRNTHLYASADRVEDFPGRCFKVVAEIKPKEASRLIPGHKAHVAVRNYPMAAAELQKKLKLQEGGSQYVIGTTLGTAPKLYLCDRLQ